MAGTMNTQMVESNLLSPLAQQRLRARIADASGSIAVVAREIRAQLAELDGTNLSGDAQAQQSRVADRAYYVAQLEYLDALARTANVPSQPERTSLLARLRSAFGRTQTAK